jgi:hypothetical protein
MAAAKASSTTFIIIKYTKGLPSWFYIYLDESETLVKVYSTRAACGTVG